MKDRRYGMGKAGFHIVLVCGDSTIQLRLLKVQSLTLPGLEELQLGEFRIY